MTELTIGQVADRAGLQTSAIRYYESAGLVPRPKRVNGRRRYDSSVFQRLGLIQLARNAGFRIGELQVLFKGFSADTPESARWQALAAGKVAELDALIERTNAARIWLTEAIRDCQCVQPGDGATVTFDDAGNVVIQKTSKKRVGVPIILRR